MLCGNCGQPLHPGALVCANCGRLVYSTALQALSEQAQSMEVSNPPMAAAIWQRCLGLLPPESPQFAMVQQRISALLGGVRPMNYSARPPAQSDPLGLAVAKTVGSMLISMLVYGLVFQDVSIAVGFVLLMLVHEMGHVIANRHYGIAASPPIFIPFMGAVINLRSSPRNALEESVIGIGGPVLGTVGALVCYALALAIPEHRGLLTEVAWLGFMLNLFNMLPVPPLDGGRVVAAVSPWLWLVGLAVLAVMVVSSFSYILILVLFFAAPRIWRTLQQGGRNSPYYQIGPRAHLTMGVAYVGLTLLLALMYYLTYQPGFL